MINMDRRLFVLLGTSVAVGGIAALRAVDSYAAQGAAANAEHFEVSFTDAEWQARLTPNQYAVLRKEGTERPFTSPLNDEHRAGIFKCAGCALALFSSSTKFDSHTGWPSFWQPLEGAVATSTDRTLGMERNEVHCKRCGGHLGHVFDDGPKPTGLRYCMNGVALTFTQPKA
jgi:peptide-methionine (R)-S-oxide reductase